MNKAVCEGRGEATGKWGERDEETISKTHLSTMVEKGHVKGNGRDKSSLERSNKETQCHDPGEVRSRSLEHAH